MAIATVNNPRVNNPAIDSKVLAAQVNLLFLHSRGIHVATIAIVILLVALFREYAEFRYVVAWLLAFTVIELGRLLIASRFHNEDIPPARARRWLYIFRVGNLLSAAAWGAAAFVLFPADSIVHQVLLAVVLTAAAAVAVPLLAVEYQSFAIFSTAAILPVALRLLSQQEPVALIAAAASIVCGGLLFAIAYRVHTDLIEAFRTRFAYADIAEEFDAEVTTRIRAEDTLRRGERRGRKQNYVLLDLAKEESISAGDLPRAMEVVTAKAAQAIHCTRISVWFCDAEVTVFRCVHLFDNGYHDAAPGIQLSTGENSQLFHRLRRMRTFAVSDARSDKRLLPFRETYLAPYRISAVLGAPFRHEGKLKGVIVIEHVGRERIWSRDERMFASSLADFLSLALSASGRQQAQEQLRHMANFDRLTALPNRAMFQDRLAHALAKAQRSNREIALLFVDVDRFKSINDSLGHHIGDRVLRSMAKRLMRCVRSSDTVARLGGDEFTVILEELDDVETIISVCDRILETVAEPLVLSDAEMTLTCSIGVAHFPNDGSDAESLLQKADTAMYRAKKNGRNKYQFYTADMHQQAMDRLERETDLRKALQREEFALVYQPQVDVSSGKVVGVEALVRWRHPLKGLISPDDFIPLAEETGLIPQLGAWVLREACRQACEWKAEYGSDFHIAVNLSVGQFILRNIPELISTVLAETGLPADMLMLEITESLAVGEGKSTLVLLQDLKQLGCRLALDDFGTGNSSLSYLKRFPVDTIKIDRSFVRDINRDAHDAAIAKATINLARSLDLQVVAEGVENAQQMEWLQAEGCSLMQGYFFAAPLNAEQCGKWLAQGYEIQLANTGGNSKGSKKAERA